MNKQEQIAFLKDKLLKEQDYICPLCEADMLQMEVKNRCLDHDHETGLVRAVVCRNCNSMEGKITGCIRRAKRNLTKEHWFSNLINHWEAPIAYALNIIHPNYKTPYQKKELRNKRARRKSKANRNTRAT
ncbi:MAG TPA: endonuclease domain-containing protein [Bacteroidia bacterium]|jgi:hypothetical protein|nr:endonuclease domain-containing protein [Bacteroidia bacterium]